MKTFRTAVTFVCERDTFKETFQSKGREVDHIFYVTQCTIDAMFMLIDEGHKLKLIEGKHCIQVNGDLAERCIDNMTEFLKSLAEKLDMPPEWVFKKLARAPKCLHETRSAKC